MVAPSIRCRFGPPTLLPATIATLSLKEMAIGAPVTLRRLGWRGDALRVKAAAKGAAQPGGNGQLDEFGQRSAPQHADCDQAQRLQPPDERRKARPQHDRVRRRIQ